MTLLLVVWGKRKKRRSSRPQEMNPARPQVEDPFEIIEFTLYLLRCSALPYFALLCFGLLLFRCVLLSLYFYLALILFGFAFISLCFDVALLFFCFASILVCLHFALLLFRFCLVRFCFCRCSYFAFYLTLL